MKKINVIFNKMASKKINGIVNEIANKQIKMTSRLFGCFIVLFLFAACERPVSPPMKGHMEPPPQEPAPVYAEIKQQPLPPQPPKVVQPPPPRLEKYKQNKSFEKDLIPMDIVFVMDTSASMCADKKNLQENIGRFVDAFVNKQSRIDYHIGVVSVWDSQRYGSAQRAFKNGQLRPVDLGQASGKKDTKLNSGSNTRNYITRDMGRNLQDLKSILKKTLYLPVENLTDDLATTGPENEEIFSPLISLTGSVSAVDGGDSLNPGFLRKDAHLGIIIMTDSDDSTPGLDPKYFANTLKKKFEDSGRSVTAMAALARYHDYKNNTVAFHQAYENPPGGLTNCSPNVIDPLLIPPGKGPERIVSFVETLTGSQNLIFDLNTKQFGDEMAKMGSHLLNTVTTYTILLEKAPAAGAEITVKVNGNILEKSEWVLETLPSYKITLLNPKELMKLDSVNVEIEYLIQ